MSTAIETKLSYRIRAAFIAPGCVIPKAAAISAHVFPAARASAISSARRRGMLAMRFWNARNVSSVSSAIGPRPFTERPAADYGLLVLRVLPTGSLFVDRAGRSNVLTALAASVEATVGHYGLRVDRYPCPARRLLM